MPKKKTNDEFIKELRYRNGNLIPLESYINNNTPILFRCTICGYEWPTLPRTVLSGHGCPKCKGSIMRSTYEFREKLHVVNPDIMVQGKYSGSKNTIDVKCRKCGFEWSPVANSIMTQGTGCPQCAGNYKLSNEQFISRIKEISPTINILSYYRNAKSEINCVCKNCGYEWSTSAAALMSGTGCSKCAGNARKTKEEFEKQLRERNPSINFVGEYKNAHTQLTVSCTICGHEWSAIPNNLLNGEGCPNCANRNRTVKQTKSEIDFRKQVLQVNSQIEIIGNYVNSHKKIKCRCKLCGYEWNPLAWDIIRGSGCPECTKTSTSYMEQIILQSLRMVLGKKNVLSRDKIAIGMELDIYIPEYKMAIEPGAWFWHSEKIDKDKEKREKCKREGVRLITIYDSYKKKDKPFDEDCLVFDYDIGSEAQHPTLRRIIEDLLMQFNHQYSFTDVEWREIENLAYIKSHKITTDDFAQRLKVVNDKIQVIGDYRGSKVGIECRCKRCGHEWEPTPVHLLQGKGCPKCAGNMRKTIDEFRAALLSTNPTITVLDEEYVNNRTEIKVRCNTCGNIWNARPANLISGYGCSVCGRKRISEKNSNSHETFLKKMQEKGKPSVIIKGKYVNYKTKIQCQCKNCGNEWKATPNSLLQGHGCKLCADLATGKAVRDRWNKR